MRKLVSGIAALSVFGLILVAFWSLAGALSSDIEAQQRAHVRDQMLVLRAELANAVTTYVQMLAPVALQLTGEAADTRRIAGLRQQLPGAESLLLLRGGEMTVLHPRADSFATAVDSTLQRFFGRLEALARARDGVVIRSLPSPEASAGRLFAAHAIRDAGGYFRGALAMELQLSPILADIGVFDVFTDIEVGVREDGDSAHMLSGHPGLFYSDAEFSTLRVGDRTWELAALPRSGWSSQRAAATRLRGIGLVVASVLSVLLLIMLWYGRRPAWFAPALLALSIVALCAALTWLVRDRNHALDRQVLLTTTTRVHHALRLRLQAHERLLQALTTAPPDPRTLDSAATRAAGYRNNNPEIDSVFVTDIDGRLRQGLTGAAAGLDAVSAAGAATAAFEQAFRTRRPAYSAPFKHPGDGAPMLQLWSPWLAQARLSGFVVLQLRLQDLLQHTPARETLREYAVMLVDTQGQMHASTRMEQALDPALRQQIATTPPGHATAIRLHAYATGTGNWNMALLLMLAGGLGAALFWAMWQLQRANQGLERDVALRTRRLAGVVEQLHRDIAERKRVETALRESETRFRSVFEQSNDAIFLIDPANDSIIDTNPVAERLLGYSSGELIGKPVHDIHPDEMAVFDSFRKQIQVHGAARSDELSCLTKSGRKVPVELSASSLRVDNKHLLLVMARDLTERRSHEAALDRAMLEVRSLKDKLEAENVYLRDEIRIQHNFEEIIGDSTALTQVLQRVEDVATTEASVLILGETGTGKELIARAVHNLSARAQRPLVKVNCAALPHDLIESELFGHEKGAFTGASARKIGRFELADSGTIFLDEIGDLPLALQSKLLRVLQEGEFDRLGAMRAVTTNVRVIAATNHDLAAAVANGQFREDLYYRLNVFPLRCPPLRERREDIPMLVEYFVRKYSKRDTKPIATISRNLLEQLQAYDWPGNVRELENVVERAVILSRGPMLELDEQLQGNAAAAPSARTLREVEHEMILEALRMSNWTIEGKRGAASRLDIPPSTLRERMQRAGIRRPGLARSG